MSGAVDLKELGTLVVVVGKARNLPNKSRFGKQDPFCTVVIGEDKQKTKPIKRGGQHPEWDEELRFSIHENVDDVLVRSESQNDSLSLNASTSGSTSKDTTVTNAAGVITSAALANKSRKGPIGKKGVKSMKVACYADDAKEPELIGETVVDIEEVLKKGEVDEWYEFTYRDKYSGEIYLELTFFSNNAPPVKRNVPRPAIHNFSGSAGVSGTPSSSISSLASKTRISELNASGSVSGMNLYIPPYMQPARTPSPAAQQPVVPPSNSFAELGLPPRNHHQSSQSLSLPGHQPYPPSHAPHATLQTPLSSLDSLTRPFSSMSIGSSRPSSTAPTPSELSAQGHGYGSHRHSVGGPSEAPWGSLLPQSQPAPAPTPLPRPASVNDAVPWDQIQRLEQERLRAGATPVPRPISSQSYATPPPLQHHSYSNPDPRIPSPIPESLRPAGPPQHAQSGRQHAQSFTTQGSTVSGSYQYSGISPAPTPPPHPNSAPPITPLAPGASNHYQLPTSSFGSFAQPPVDQYRASSPGPAYYQSQMNGAYGNASGSNSHYQPGYGGGTPTRRDSYPSQPPPQEHQHTYPPSQSQTPQPSYQPQSGYSYAQRPISPHRQPSPAPPPPPPANDNGYVPWYQQTQPQQTPPPPPPNQYPSYGQQQQAQGSQYNSPAPPPIPGYRPVPQPPPPPKPQPVGYYPSDELYAQRQDAQTLQPQHTNVNGWNQQRPLFDQSTNSYASQHQDQSYGSSGTEPTGYPPPSTFSPPPQQQNWHGHSSINSHSGGYGRSPSPQPPTQTQTGGTYYNQAPPPPVDQNEHNNHRAPSPQPPMQMQMHDQNKYYRAPSPQPQNLNGNSNGTGYRTSSPQPPSQNHVYQRAPSPQPLMSQAQAQIQVQNHNHNYNHNHYAPHSNSGEQLVPPNRSHSPNPAPTNHHNHQPSGSGSGSAKADWRSYMQSLGTRSPSPQPPPPPKDNIYQQQQQQQQQWYTPPPSLPASIAPPEGWRSTLPANKDGHQWRG